MYNDTNYLQVEEVTPALYTNKVNVHTDIKVTFNYNLNTESIINNFFLLRDVNNEYTFKKNDTINIDNFEVVKGALTYKNRTIIFTPKEPLEASNKYIIYVKTSNIYDVLGNTSSVNYTSYFETEGIPTYKPCNILEPIDNSVLTDLEKIVIEDVNAKDYIVQISRQKTFENIVYNKLVNETTIEAKFSLPDGTYYIRARANGGDFGDTIAIAIKTYQETIPTDEDISEKYAFVEIEEEELLDIFPKENNIDPATNLCYVKISGEITEKDIDFDNSYLYGELSDTDDESNTNMTAHGYVDVSYSIVYDKNEDCTYIFAIPNIL